MMLKPEKEEYEKKYGDSESRASFAAYEIEKIIESNTRQVELCNGVVTTEHERKWALEHLEEMAGKHCVSTGDIKKQLNNDLCNGVQREHNKKLNNGLPILHKVPPKRDYGRYFCIMAEKGGTSHGGLTEKLSPFFHAKKQEVNAYGR
uniref:hypothetical protein n=1 Tax=Faecalibacterium prausnitzii TaxID=853 RepID=UPI003FEFBF0C